MTIQIEPGETVRFRIPGEHRHRADAPQELTGASDTSGSWSSTRIAATWTFFGVLVAYVGCELVGRIVRVPDDVIGLLRVVLILAGVAWLGSMAWDATSAPLLVRLNGLRMGLHGLAGRVESCVTLIADANVKLVRADSRYSRLHDRVVAAECQVARLEPMLSAAIESNSRLAATVAQFADAIVDYGADKRQEGYEAAMRKWEMGLRDMAERVRAEMDPVVVPIQRAEERRRRVDGR